MITLLFDKIKTGIQNLKLKQKILITYYIFILFPLLTYTFYSYQKVSKTTEFQFSYSAHQSLEQAALFLDNKFSNVTYVSDLIIQNNNLNKVLTTRPQNYRLVDKIEDANELTKFLNSLKKPNEIGGIRVYMSSDLLYSNEKVLFFSLNDIINLDWYKRFIEFYDKIIWCPPNYFPNDTPTSGDVLFGVRRLLNANNYNELLGIIRIDIPQKVIHNIVSNATVSKDGIAYLQNSQGQILASTSSGKLNVNFIDSQFCISLASKKNNWNTYVNNGKKLLVGCKFVGGSDLILVSAIPFEEILKISTSSRNEMLLLMLGIAAISYILAYFTSESVTKKINHLIKRMKNVQKGNFSTITSPHGNDEMGELIENFNFMILKILVLMDKKYELGIEVKNIEIKALQSQINPHFLYNTLDFINWSALDHNVPEISSLVQALAKYYKLSLSKGKDIVSIRDEISHVQMYIQIQNSRFQNKITLELDIDEEVYIYKTLKIILQPIVENSIIHGILVKKGAAGIIKIVGRVHLDHISLKVEDNGVGIAPEKMDTLLHECDTSETNSYGMKNINSRIKLLYGEQYGLSISSRLNEGTTVLILIKKIQ